MENEEGVGVADMNGEAAPAAETGNEPEAIEISDAPTGAADVSTEEEWVDPSTVKVKEEENSDSEGDFEESDDDDDDNINVVIGDVNPQTVPGSGLAFGSAVNWKKPTDGTASTAVKTVAVAPTSIPAVGSAITTVSGQKKIDLNAVGLVNGQPIYEFDMESSDEKPWRKPGADLSDYFNYGFNEDTWKQYCEKHRRTKLDYASSGLIQATPFVVPPNSLAPSSLTALPMMQYEVLPDGRVRAKAGPPPDRKVAGSIQVIGGEEAQKKKESDLLTLALGQNRLINPLGAVPRPIYQRLPDGSTVVYNPIQHQMQIATSGQPQFLTPHLPTSSAGGIMPGIDQKPMIATDENGLPPTSRVGAMAGDHPISSQPQHMPIQTFAGLSGQALNPGLFPTSAIPAGLRPINPMAFDPNLQGLQPLLQPGQQIFQQGGPPPSIDYSQGDPFLFPGAPPSANWDGSDPGSDFDSDGENKRHRRRAGESRHRRHRGERSEKDRSDRSKAPKDRERSSSRRTREHSTTREHSDRTKSSRKSGGSGRGDEAGGERRRTRRKERSDKGDGDVEVKQEPEAE